MSIVEKAGRELAAINFGEEDSLVMVQILEKFFSQWDSGGAVSVAAPVLARLLEGKPLSPLTGEWGEWVDMSASNGGEPIWQNLRCSSVFKKPINPNGDGKTWAYDIDAPGQDGLPDWRPIRFPYMPGEIAPSGIPIMAQVGDISDEAMREWHQQPITGGAMPLGRMDPSGERLGPAVMHDPILGALDAIRCYICEQRDLNAQLAAQVVAEGEHTAAANAKLEDLLKTSIGDWKGQ